MRCRCRSCCHQMRSSAQLGSCKHQWYRGSIGPCHLTHPQPWAWCTQGCGCADQTRVRVPADAGVGPLSEEVLLQCAEFGVAQWKRGGPIPAMCHPQVPGSKPGSESPVLQAVPDTCCTRCSCEVMPGRAAGPAGSCRLLGQVCCALGCCALAAVAKPLRWVQRSERAGRAAGLSCHAAAVCPAAQMCAWQVAWPGLLGAVG